MKLILGLGNPDDRYAATRHNVGFSVLDTYAKQHETTFSEKPKFKATVAELTVGEEKVILVKPHTYYNLVGESLRAVMDFYKLTPEDVLVVHDELALPFGTIRTRIGGSDAGNNGIKSVNQHGGETTARLRIGIANDQRTVMEDTDFVLARFTAAESEVLPGVIMKTIAILDDFIAGRFPVSTQQ